MPPQLSEGYVQHPITANVSVAYNHRREVLAAQSDAWRPACVHLCEIPLNHTQKHTRPLVDLFHRCARMFFFWGGGVSEVSVFILAWSLDCNSAVEVKGRWRRQAVRSFPQVKGAINSEAEGDSNREATERVCGRLCSESVKGGRTGCW